MKPPQILESLNRASRELPKAEAPVHSSEIGNWVRSIPFWQLSAADEAIEEYLEKKLWPVLHENDVLAQIHLRFEAAKDLMSSEGVELSDLALEEVLELLLLRFWHGRGMQWAEHRYGRRVN